MPVYNRLKGAERRIDFWIQGPLFAHGILGQGLARPREGRHDVYPKKGNYTTRAQAEDAIDGIFTDYIVNGPFDTSFRYSLFNSTTPQPHNTTGLVEANDTLVDR